MNAFDPVAADFDRFRALPEGVPGAFRDAVRVAVGPTPGARLLEVGAGTGRFGSAFGEDGDNYFGVDASGQMLRQFAARAPGSHQRLVQADGLALPFAEGTFDVVLLLHVLSGVPRWRRMLAEACRVLRRGGAFIIGKVVGPTDGLDARMRGRLGEMMEAEGLFAGRRGGNVQDAGEVLSARAQHHARTVAARWESARTPRGFLERHRTGARFQSLPADTREALLSRLSEWAVTEFGSLEAESVEPYELTLDVFTF